MSSRIVSRCTGQQQIKQVTLGRGRRKSLTCSRWACHNLGFFVRSSLLTFVLALCDNLFTNLIFHIPGCCVLFNSAVFPLHVQKCIQYQIFCMLTPCLSCYVNNEVENSLKQLCINGGKTQWPVLVDDSSMMHSTVVVDSIQFALGHGLGWS